MFLNMFNIPSGDRNVKDLFGTGLN